MALVQNFKEFQICGRSQNKSPSRSLRKGPSNKNKYVLSDVKALHGIDLKKQCVSKLEGTTIYKALLGGVLILRRTDGVLTFFPVSYFLVGLFGNHPNFCFD